MLQFVNMVKTVLTLDQLVHEWFVLIRDDSLTAFFSFITQFGNWNGIFFALLCASALLYFRNRKHVYMLPIWTSFISASVATYVLKLLTARPRPFEALVIENSFSFPSMHATLSVAVYGLLMYLVVKNIQKQVVRNVYILLGFILIILIGTSRLYLGVHYVSDVLFGYVVGGVGVLLGIYLHKRFAVKTFK